MSVANAAIPTPSCDSYTSEEGCLKANKHCGWCLDDSKCKKYNVCTNKVDGCSSNFTLTDVDRETHKNECTTATVIAWTMLVVVGVILLVGLVLCALECSRGCIRAFIRRRKNKTKGYQPFSDL